MNEFQITPEANKYILPNKESASQTVDLIKWVFVWMGNLMKTESQHIH